jgi:hypothetical protein
MYLKPAQPPASTMIRSPLTGVFAPSIAVLTAFNALSVRLIIAITHLQGTWDRRGKRRANGKPLLNNNIY